MSDNDSVNAAWTSRLPGTLFAGGQAGGPGDIDTLEATKGQFTAPSNALRSSRDDDLIEVTKFGFDGVIGNHSARFTAAPIDFGTGLPDASSPQKAIGIIAPFRQYFASNERIAACDDYPFRIDVAIRSTLKPALAALQTVLERSVATRR